MNKVEKAIELLSAGADVTKLDASVLMDAKLELERQMVELKMMQDRFNNEMEVKKRNFDASVQLFNMKWSLLEEETRRLADESARAEKRKQFFDRVHTYQTEEKHYDNVVNAELFFKGVASPQALRKRYKDLIKIYHPDAECGDKQIVQEINREYANLKHAMVD
ncbi:MAG: molecular chaperone DnaJ [Lachnospiraceae bacterium]|nr:molecular chaperone DnaJ [Lachnospiraceae bacterium]